MTDRELLEAAARASGVTICWVTDHLRRAPMLVERGVATYWWNPLESDGDALRLAVKLKLTVSQADVTCSVYVGGDIAVVASLSGDPYAATRRAIVRAAAAMAKEPQK